MEDMYGFYSTSSTGDYNYYGEDKPLMSPVPENLIIPPSDYQALLYSTGAGAPEVFRDHHHHHYHHNHHRIGPGYDATFGSDMEFASVVSETASIAPEMNSKEEDAEDIVKARIKSHPSYPRLLEAYIDCQKVGAPPEIAGFLEEIRRENGLWKRTEGVSSYCFGADPELDDFMETYIDMLVKYKADLARPFDEATTFLNKIEMQLSNLSTASLSDEGGGSSDDEFSGGEAELMEAQPSSEDRGLKDRLLRKFGSHISSLKLEFSKKKKKGKLPKEARQMLLDWWNVHYKWPYPTEADKNALAQSTGLDQKQINNWFINQRKRHWKPSENMQLALMDNLPGQYLRDD